MVQAGFQIKIAQCFFNLVLIYMFNNLVQQNKLEYLHRGQPLLVTPFGLLTLFLSDNHHASFKVHPIQNNFNSPFSQKLTSHKVVVLVVEKILKIVYYIFGFRNKMVNQ